MLSSHNQLYIQAALCRERLQFPFITITGSNGKTTTKKMLGMILQRTGRVYQFDHESDTPDRIARELLHIEGRYDWALAKVGASSSDSIAQAAALLQPRVAIITNVGEAHLAFHGTIEKIAAAKRALLQVLPPDGIAILNRDNEYTKEMGLLQPGRVVFFGLSPLSDYYASDIVHQGPQGTSFNLTKKEQPPQRLTMAIYSLGDVYNALAAFATASELGIDSDTICAALEDEFQLPDGRGRLHSFANLHLLDDTHDATPQSFYKSTKSLTNFRDYARRLIFVMGEISKPVNQLEMLQTMMGHYLAGMPIDILVLVGHHAAATARATALARGSKKRVIQCVDTSDARNWLQKNIKQGDVVLIEGGESVDMSVIVRDLVDFCTEKWGTLAVSPKTTS